MSLVADRTNAFLLKIGKTSLSEVLTFRLENIILNLQTTKSSSEFSSHRHAIEACVIHHLIELKADPSLVEETLLTAMQNREVDIHNRFTVFVVGFWYIVNQSGGSQMASGLLQFFEGQLRSGQLSDTFNTEIIRMKEALC